MMPLTPDHLRISKKYFVENVADKKTLKVIKFGLIPIYGSKVMGKKPIGGHFCPPDQIGLKHCDKLIKSLS